MGGYMLSRELWRKRGTRYINSFA